MRLNAYLAQAGVASRRGADKLIIAGRVTVNGKLGQLNDAVNDASMVRVDGKPVHAQRLRYALLYKPAGCVTTLKDEEGRRKVIDLVQIAERVVPVGRLDFNTTGALLLTNDGELAHQLMYPSFKVNKVYEATVEGEVTAKKLNVLSNGVDLEDGKTAPAQVRKLGENKVEIIIHEGRNHQIKRMLAAVGLETKKLHRSQYGLLNLDDLKPGQWRDLTNSEISALKVRK